MNNTYMVYCHTNLLNGKRYVGISCRKTYKRWGKEGSGYKNCTLFWKAIKKYGWSGFNHTVLHKNLSKQEAENLEIKYISDWKLTNPKYGYNLLKGGNTNCPLEETKEKISLSLKKYYKEHPEKIQELKEKNKKYFNTEENKQKCKERSLKVYKERPEIKEKIRKTVIENYKKHPEILEKLKKYSRKDIKKVICVETGVVYGKVTDAAKSVGCSISLISAACRGSNRVKTAMGYHWQYVEPEYD